MGRTVSVALLCWCRAETATDSVKIMSVLCFNHISLWTLKLEFPIIFTYHEIVLNLFFQLFTNIKTVLSSRAIQTQAAGEIWV